MNNPAEYRRGGQKYKKTKKYKNTKTYRKYDPILVSREGGVKSV